MRLLRCDGISSAENGKRKDPREVWYWITRMAESRVDGRIHGAGTREVGY
jgi:hypothetical protein